MRLQVEQELQAMLGLAQEAVGVVEDAVFLIGQAADVFQGLQGQERVALADVRQVAAVEQLQELDGELDVADAAVAGLDLGVAGRRPGCVFCSMRRFSALISLISAKLRYLR